MSSTRIARTGRVRDTDAGCVVVARPDRCVAHVLPPDARDALTECCAAQKPGGRPTSGRV